MSSPKKPQPSSDSVDSPTLEMPVEQTLDQEVPREAPAATPVPAPPALEPVLAPVLTGPAPFTVLLGLLAIVGAIGAFLRVNLGLVVNWTAAGPAVVLGSGVVLVALGLLSMRRRS